MEDGGGSTSPNSLKRKRESQTPTPSNLLASDVAKAAKLTNGTSSHATSRPQNSTSSDPRLPSSTQYTSPDSDEMQHSDSGDLLRGIGSASSLNSTASSVFSHNSHNMANNRKASIANGFTPLTTHSESSPPKGNSPHHSKSAAAITSTNGVSATSHMPPTDLTPIPQTRSTRPQMLPPPGKAKGYKVVWDPELDSKLSREERKRAQPRRREFGTEVRCIFHNYNPLSLQNMMIHIT